MPPEEIKIEVYDKQEKTITTMYVQQIAADMFRMLDNDVFNGDLTLGTEFQTRLDEDGRHEIISIVKKSEFITRRFFLTDQFKEPEYRLLGDEIIKQGGFWQVDFSSIATINLPKDCELDMDEIFSIFDFKPAEIVD